jgi:hypothetical protein
MAAFFLARNFCFLLTIGPEFRHDARAEPRDGIDS